MGGKSTDQTRRPKPTAESLYQLEDVGLIILNLSTLGNIESRAGNYLAALRHFQAVDSICRTSEKDRAYSQGIVLLNIGIICSERLGDDSLALVYTGKARECMKRTNSEESLAAVDHREAIFYQNLQQLERSDTLMSRALEKYRAINFPRRIAELSMNYANLQQQLNHPEKAKMLLKEAYDTYVKIGDKAGRANSLAEIGILNQNQHRHQEAISAFREALTLQESADVRRDILKKLSESLHSSGQIGTAYDSLLSYIALSDTLGSHQLESELRQAEMRYQTSNTQRELTELKLSQAQKDKQNLMVKFMGGILLVILLFSVILLQFRSRQKQRLNLQLRELDELKSRLFAEISHELRTPIALIKGPVDLALAERDVSPGLRHQLQIINRNTGHLTHLVDSVNDLNQLDAGKIDLHLRKGDLLKHLKVIAASFESMAISKNLHYEIDIDLNAGPYSYDPKHLETIIFNLLSNAFKYTATGLVKLRAEDRDGSVSISVQDTGPGFTEEVRSKIFERYYRHTGEEYAVEGLGIGLALCSKLTELHHGELKVESNPGIGSTFTLIVPTNEKYYESKGLVIEGAYEIQEKTGRISAYKSPTNQLPELSDEPLLLLVEDNVDMRNHLEEIFESQYRIMSAQDGDEALKMANKYVPDIIISDLMMPGINGIELLEQLRETSITSHIPFILLTANRDERKKVDGLKAGAYDYLVKPFSIEELRSKVENLVLWQHKLKDRFKGQGSLNELPEESSEVDKRFWQELQDVLKVNLSREDFSAEDFARAMHLSRMQLHRKLKALTNHSTTSFIKEQRLKKATQLLRSTSLGITEVAFEVGFSSPNYFFTTFKEQFGVTPSEYRHGKPDKVQP